MHETQKNLIELTRNKNIARLSYREIGKEIGIEHPQKVKHHLEQLRKKGILIIDRASDTQNITERGKKASGLISFPIFSAANCGEATLLAEENLEGYLRVSTRVLSSAIVRKSRSIFALRAEGNSMNRARKPINDGDYVLIDPEHTSPSNGDYILSIIDGLANIKRFEYEDNRILLLSDSTSPYPPIIISTEDNYLINGKIVEVIKTQQIKWTI